MLTWFDFLLCNSITLILGGIKYTCALGKEHLNRAIID
jgi:hypothetical protein